MNPTPVFPETQPPAGHADDDRTGTNNIFRLDEINTAELAELAGDGAIVILPISPIEEHGPHLPMGTDAINAAFFAEMTAEIIRAKAPDTPVIMAPLVPLGTHVYRFMGSIFIGQRTIRNLVIDYGRSLAASGFRRFVIVSAHGGPGHLVALDEAATLLTRRYRIDTINLTSTIIYGFLSGKLVGRISDACDRPLTADERKVLSQDYHAGWWETAMMLLLRPELVKDGFRTLPDALVPRWKLRPKSPLKPPAGQGYLGAPSRADTEFARASVKALRAEAEQLIATFLRGGIRPSQYRSRLYYVPIFRTNFKYWVLFLIIALLLVMRAFS